MRLLAVYNAAMQPNPYESPRPGDPVSEKPPLGSDPVVQLLMEIRDCQRESLELTRAALTRAALMRPRSMMLSTLPFMILMLLVPVITFGLINYLMAKRLPLPTPVPKTVIVPMPPGR